MERLKRFFHVAHIHFNNASCLDGLAPFPSWAYEVLFVSKRLGVVDPSRTAGGLHDLDARNNPAFDDCQPVRENHWLNRRGSRSMVRLRVSELVQSSGSRYVV